MSNKFTKITFCRYLHPKVEELATWNYEYINQAKKCVKLHNDTVIGPSGKYENEFWFLNTKIKGNTVIITSDKQGEFPSNDPDIVAKLEAYIEGLKKDETGHAQNRGIAKQFKSKNRLK